MKIEVKSTATKKRTGTSAKGRAYDLTEQEVWFSFASGEVRKTTVVLQDNAAPYPVGEYVIGEASFQVNNFGSLEIGRLVLESAVSQLRKAG